MQREFSVPIFFYPLVFPDEIVSFPIIAFFMFCVQFYFFFSFGFCCFTVSHGGTLVHVALKTCSARGINGSKQSLECFYIPIDIYVELGSCCVLFRQFSVMYVLVCIEILYDETENRNKKIKRIKKNNTRKLD